MTVLGVIGSTALWLLYAWLAAAIVCQYLSERKGYGGKPGLAAGLLLTVVGVIVWLAWPAKPDSKWKLQGPLPFQKGEGGKTVAQMRAELEEEQHEGENEG